MAKKKKREKFLNSAFAPANLLGAEIKAFLDACDDEPAIVSEYRHAAGTLAFLVVHPEELASAWWFPPFYAKHPRFTLEFMVAMRRAYAAKSTGEKWLHSFEAMARQNQKDGAIEQDLRERGVKIKARELSTARAKLSAGGRASLGRPWRSGANL